MEEVGRLDQGGLPAATHPGDRRLDDLLTVEHHDPEGGKFGAGDEVFEQLLNVAVRWVVGVGNLPDLERLEGGQQNRFKVLCDEGRRCVERYVVRGGPDLGDRQANDEPVGFEVVQVPEMTTG